ncbi:ABC transporter ATP-binding protein [Pedobacter metabolipauper]|uniref:ABC-2 type transport system ATP-binding protein n=1 Tax=Pedobacter metabolipauper TaxID=425513 RepID=A0A4R6SV81_9SPHI|nr:ATP-binding cassette domain-containing protein [Pedobacter metabolipauper]TDQ09281.1 ABC-2 type transport system ATP-binding protein [Pedobacter metabolipauper]
MSDLIIETRGLNYYFGTQKVVDDLSLKVKKGSIYGFLGPNGAGKTTSIKILLNLLKSPKDTVFLFGKEINSNRIASLKRLGALVEQPAIYAHMTGRENLVNRCMLLNIDKAKSTDLLELVGLSDAANKKAGKYSLGMKQRLGIALALLSDPELLLLDEPTNGLDPNGIIEIRNLMIDLASKHGKTILVSSHLLSEIERIASHVGIINKGKLLFQGTINELHDLSKPTLEIEVQNAAQAASLLTENGYELIATTENKISLLFKSAEENGKINTLLVQNGFIVTSIYQIRKDLEHLFLDITKNN